MSLIFRQETTRESQKDARSGMIRSGDLYRLPSGDLSSLGFPPLDPKPAPVFAMAEPIGGEPAGGGPGAGPGEDPGGGPGAGPSGDPGGGPGAGPGGDPGGGPGEDPGGGPGAGPGEDPGGGPGEDPGGGPGEDPGGGPGAGPGEDPGGGPGAGPGEDPGGGPGGDIGDIGGDPEDPSKVRGESVEEKSPRDIQAADNITDTAAKTEAAQKKAANMPPSEKESPLRTFGLWVGISLVSGIALQFLTPLIQYIIAKIKGDTKQQDQSARQAGLTPKQRTEIDSDITKWLNLSDKDAWIKLYNTIKGEQLSPSQQILLYTFVMKARAPSYPVEWRWTATQKNDFINELAATSPDEEMINVTYKYRLNGKALPFTVGAECIIMALVRKYPDTADGS
ncbi:hypothetical protein [Sorangium sp. So ce861]|uniref:hypothetical protein n=1 Tax=Sorangium sp. So ce861 TaxID=3133323 RepID=UPI003F5E99DF